MSYDGGDGRQLWQRWTIETAFNGGGGGVVDNICLFNSKELGGSFSQNDSLLLFGVWWRQQRSTAFDGVGDGLRLEDERVAQGEAMQQPASTMRGQEGGAMRGRREMMM